MNATFLHFSQFGFGSFLYAEPGTMLLIAGGVLLAGVVVGFFLLNESKKESNR